jgi:hypothetical protein
LATLVSSPFAAESLSDAEGFVVLTSPDGTDADAEVAARLASLPCVVIGRGRSPGARPPMADVVPEDGVATVDDLLRAIGENPTAATSLAMLLRHGHHSLGPGLVAESAVFSLLQSGVEFTTWSATEIASTSCSTDPTCEMR